VKRLFCLIFAVAMLVGCLFQATEDNYVDLSSWVGVYEFSEFAEGVGSNHWMHLNIIIFNENGEYFADFYRIGRMTRRRFTTRVVGDSDEISFIFYHHLVLSQEYPEFISSGAWNDNKGDINRV